MGVEAGGIDADKTAQLASTKNRWSVRPHEQLIGMVILAAAFVVGSLSVDAGLRSRNELPKSDQITVTGSAERTVTADTFQWGASVASTQPTTSAALAQLGAWTAQIRVALDNAGAHDDEITFGPVQVQPNTGQTGAVATFTESQTVTVQSRRLSAMGRVGREQRASGQERAVYRSSPGVHLQRPEAATTGAHGRGDRRRPSARPSSLGPPWPFGEVDLDLGGPVLR